MSDTVIKDMHKWLKGQLTRKDSGFVFKYVFNLRTKRRNIGREAENIIKYRSATKGDNIQIAHLS